MIPFFQGAASGAPVASQVFAATLWTGNGGVQTVTTGINLSAGGGLAWLKNRDLGSGSADAHNVLYDTVRGAGVGCLCSNLTDAESLFNDNADTGELSSFGTTGLNLSRSRNGERFVAWSFARAARFFDVVTYTGTGANRTVSHSLGTTPGMIIVKRRDTTGAWPVYHRANTGAPETDYLVLNTTAATADLDTYWNDTAPTSSVFTVGTNADVNASGGTYVAYLFAHDTAGDGIVQCGSYTGNGSATGPTVTLGWNPQFVMIKRTDGSTNWVMFDTARGIVAGNDPTLVPNSYFAEDAVEAAGDYLDLTGTGFQLASTSSTVNANTGTYAYLAIRSA